MSNVSDRNAEAAYEEQRALWKYSVDVLADRLCGNSQCRVVPTICPFVKVRSRLLDAIDQVPDLDVLIRKVEPDMAAFAESRMTPRERYRF